MDMRLLAKAGRLYRSSICFGFYHSEGWEQNFCTIFCLSDQPYMTLKCGPITRRLFSPALSRHSGTGGSLSSGAAALFNTMPLFGRIPDHLLYREWRILSIKYWWKSRPIQVRNITGASPCSGTLIALCDLPFFPSYNSQIKEPPGKIITGRLLFRIGTENYLP